jgi:hypothetical protein
MFLQLCRDVFILSIPFIQRYRLVVRDAAWERHHRRNINVGGNIGK